MFSGLWCTCTRSGVCERCQAGRASALHRQRGFPGNRPVRTMDLMVLVPVLLNGLWVFCGLAVVTHCCDRVARFVTRYLPASRGRAVLYFTNAKTCDGRESNPGQLLGRQLCSPLYHHRWVMVRLGDCNAVDFLASRSVCSVSFE